MKCITSVREKLLRILITSSPGCSTTQATNCRIPRRIPVGTFSAQENPALYIILIPFVATEQGLQQLLISELGERLDLLPRLFGLVMEDLGFVAFHKVKIFIPSPAIGLLNRISIYCSTSGSQRIIISIPIHTHPHTNIHICMGMNHFSDYFSFTKN